jgi:hypothetical protein
VDEDRAIAADAANSRGEPLPPSAFPNESYAMRADNDASRAGRQPALFRSDFWYVSAECAAVLRDHDLGRGALYPVRLFRQDRRTALGGVYFCLNFGNVKEAFLPEQSPNARPAGAAAAGKMWWLLPPVPQDGDMAVSRTALGGPDVWIDPLLKQAFFVSDRLRTALEAAGFADLFSLLRCRVLGAELDRSRLPSIYEQAKREYKAAAAKRLAAGTSGQA